VRTALAPDSTMYSPGQSTQLFLFGIAEVAFARFASIN
jgi:hypothetical protein